LASTTATIPNIVNTNISTGTINATTVSASTLVSSTITGGNASLSGLLSAPNIVGTNISASTLSAPTITGGNLSLSGNLTIAGTLTTVNITSTNVLQTNVSAGTIASTNATVTNIVGTNISSGTARITTSLISLGNSNTVGNIYTTGGNVGVGTVSPGSSLHVAGSIPVSPVGNGVHMGIDPSTYTAIQLNSTAGNYIDFGTSGGDYQSRIIAGNTGNLSIQTNGVSNNGYVGINTASPSYTLDVTGTSRISSALTIGTGNTGVFTHQSISSNTNFPMAFCANAGNLASFLFGNATQSTGYVSINNVASGYTLDVSGTGRFAGKLTITGSNGSTGFDTAINDQYADMRVIRNSSSPLDKDMYLQLGAGATSTLHMYSNNSETMTLKGGNVGINNSSPTYKLDVVGTTRIGGSHSIIYNNYNGGEFPSGNCISIEGNSGAGGSSFNVNSGHDSTNTRYIMTVTRGGSSPATLFSIRMDGDTYINNSVEVNGTIKAGNQGLKFWYVTGTHGGSSGTTVSQNTPSGLSVGNITSITGVTFQTNGDCIPFNYSISDSGWNADVYVNYNNVISVTARGVATLGKIFRLTIVTIA
jgi:hypothetical protein